MFANTVYVKVYPNRFELRQIESGKSIMAISLKPFTTERLLVGQFSEADETLRDGMKKIYKQRLISFGPVVVIQPMEKTEGGLSQIEERVFKELASGAGARKVTVWVGHALSDQEVLAKVNGV